MGVLAGYDGRISIPVTYTTAGAQTNYTKQLTIVKGTGSDSAGVIYLNNLAKNWPYDIRFTKADGTTLLDFYREESDATDGTWHVELDSIADSGDTDFYLYYGKTSDSDASNGPNTFLVFDDVELGDFSQWTTAEANWSAQDTVKFAGSYAAQAAPGSSNRQLLKTLTLNNCIFRFRVRVNSLGSANRFYPVLCLTSSSVYIYALDLNTGHFEYQESGNWHNLPTDTTYEADTWYLVEVALDFVNSLFRWWVDGVSKGTAELKDEVGTTLTVAHSLQNARLYTASSTVTGFIDDYWVRKYVYPEPAWSTPGAHENLAASWGGTWGG